MLAVLHQEAVVPLRRGGIGTTGLICSQDERFPQADTALLSGSAVGAEHPGAVLPGHPGAWRRGCMERAGG